MNISKRNVALSLLAMAACTASAINITMTPVAGFGPGGLRAGWLENSELPTRMDTNNLYRGLAFNAATGNLLLCSRLGGNNIAILDAATGAELGTMNMGTGVITGGAVGISKIACSSDGQIFATNISTAMPTSPYKFYRWANEGDTLVAANAFSVAPLTGARAGDTLDLQGSGNNIQLAGGYSNSPAVTGNNSYAIMSWDGSALTATHIPLVQDVNLKPFAGDFRLGISFVDSTSVIGAQTGNDSRVSTFDLGTPSNSTVANVALTAGNERAFDVGIIGGVPMLATVDSGSGGTPNSGTLVCRIYDMTNPLTPVSIGSARIPTAADTATLALNLNGSGHVQFGPLVGDKQRIYFLSTNNGIQAFDIGIAAGSISGNVNLDATSVGAFIGDTSLLTMKMYFYEPGTGTLVRPALDVPLDASGNYNVKPGIAPGNYDIYLQGPTWLSKGVFNQALTTSDLSAFDFSLINGDCDNNDAITTDDYLIISNAFDTGVGDELFDARGDLNGDGFITTDDYLILSGDFDLAGERPV